MHVKVIQLFLIRNIYIKTTYTYFESATEGTDLRRQKK